MRPAVIFAALAVLLSPFLFVIYRLSVFNTVPHDNYAAFLLWTAGNSEGALPESPYCYRILSMLAALPLYFVTPAIRLTNIPADLTSAYLRATFALSMLAFFATIAAAMLMARLGSREFGFNRSESVLAGALLFALVWYTQITSIDPLAILLIAAAICLLRRPVWFALMVLVSVPVNEKVALVLACWLSVRCLMHPDARARLWRQWASALAGVVLYAAIVKFVRLPGNEYQVDPINYPATAIENAAAWFTGRGIMLNALPAIVLGALGIAGHWARAPDRVRDWFRPTDLLVIPILLAVALIVTHLFQAGRIVLHAAPLFVIPAVLALRRPVAP
jgi:hypothetical protein